MTISEEILICANQFANEGKKPTVALIKGKLSQRIPLPIIIQTLKNWQHEPSFIKKPETAMSATSQIKDKESSLGSAILEEQIKLIVSQTVERELTDIKKELNDMKTLIKTLTAQRD